MPTKENGSGKQQEYDAKTGRYGNGNQKGEAQRVFARAKELGVPIDKDHIDYNALKNKVAIKESELKNKNKGDIINLTKQEWAQYYKIIGDEQHGDFVYRLQDGGRMVRLENKLVFDNGSFIVPIVHKVITFANNDLMNDYLNYIGGDCYE